MAIRDFILELKDKHGLEMALDALTEMELETEDDEIFHYCEELRCGLVCHIQNQEVPKLSGVCGENGWKDYAYDLGQEELAGSDEEVC